MTLPLLTLYQKIVKLVKDCKTSKQTQVKNIKKHNQGKDCKNITDDVCKKKIKFLYAHSTKNCGGKIASTAHARVEQSTTKLHRVAKRVQHYTTSCKTKEMLYRTTFV